MVRSTHTRRLKVYNNEIREFGKFLQAHRQYLTRQQFKTLMGQSFTDHKAARKGLVKILNNQGYGVQLGRW